MYADLEFIRVFWKRNSICKLLKFLKKERYSQKSNSIAPFILLRILINALVRS